MKIKFYDVWHETAVIDQTAIKYGDGRFRHKPFWFEWRYRKKRRYVMLFVANFLMWIWW